MTARRPIVLAAGARQEVKDGDTVLTPASGASGAGLRLPHGAAPAAPADGDVWTTSAGIFVQVDGVTLGPLGTGSVSDIYMPLAIGSDPPSLVALGDGRLIPVIWSP